MCNRAVFEDPFLTVYCPNRYKTQIMCDVAVDNSPTALKFISDWIVTSKMIKKLFTDFWFVRRW